MSADNESLLAYPNQELEQTDGFNVMPNDPRSMTLASALNLDEACLTQIFEVYFDHIQPAFPLFRRPVFFHDYSRGLLPLDLLTVMIALAARFSAQVQLFKNLDLDGWKTVLSRSHMRNFPAGSDVLDLNTVKKECLVAIFEYTQSPGLKAWRQAGVMARTAIGYGLHKVEDLKSRGLLADDELEECRFVWWTIWKLDTCFNGVASTQLGIDDRFTNTNLVSTNIEDFTAGNVQASTETRLDIGVQGFEQCSRIQSCASAVDLQNLEIFFVGLIRQTHTLRCHMSTAPNGCREDLKNVRSICTVIRTCLPSWFFNPQRNVERQETTHKHRLRLMTLLQFNVLRITCHLPIAEVHESAMPLDLTRWQKCVGFAKENVSLFQCWDVTYDTQVDPMIICIIWYTCALLAIQAMSINILNVTENGDRRHLETELDDLANTLRRFGSWWSLSEKLLDSVDQLRLWTWLDVDSPGMRDLVERLRILLDPSNPEPTRIDVGFPHIAM